MLQKVFLIVTQESRTCLQVKVNVNSNFPLQGCRKAILSGNCFAILFQVFSTKIRFEFLIVLNFCSFSSFVIGRWRFHISDRVPMWPNQYKIHKQFILALYQTFSPGGWALGTWSMKRRLEKSKTIYCLYFVLIRPHGNPVRNVKTPQNDE
jgi:hypothetical protein